MAQVSVERAVVRQWQAASAALAQVRAEELRNLSEAEALAAADALLQLLPMLPPSDAGSGLVEQQRLFSLAAA